MILSILETTVQSPISLQLQLFLHSSFSIPDILSFSFIFLSISAISIRPYLLFLHICMFFKLSNFFFPVIHLNSAQPIALSPSQWRRHGVQISSTSTSAQRKLFTSIFSTRIRKIKSYYGWRQLKRGYIPTGPHPQHYDPDSFISLIPFRIFANLIFNSGQLFLSYFSMRSTFLQWCRKSGHKG